MDVTVVSHTHWDREWYQTFQQFRYQLVDLVDQVLEILQHNSDYRYFMLDGQTILLEDYLEVRPERESELRELVRSGRLLVGPWYVLPDEFLVSGESLVRNLLVGDKLAARYGERMPVGYIPDPFGHPSQIPQILEGVGIDTAILRRGLADEPALLWWQAPDGSRVFTVYLRDSYDNAAWLPQDAQLFPGVLKRTAARIGEHTPVPHALLMHGTDHMFPTPELPRLLEIADDALPDVRVQHGTLPAYVADVRRRLDGDDLPTVYGELRNPKRHHLLPGVWSARMWIKQRNAAVQTALERYAEPLATFGRAYEGPDRRGHLWNAWRLLLQNHPHDSICGCSIDQTHQEMKPRFDQAEQIADLVARDGLTALARQIDVTPLLEGTPAPSWPVVAGIYTSAPLPIGWTVAAYNPTVHSVTAPVDVEVPVVPPGYTYEVFDADGEPVNWELIARPASEGTTSTLSAAELSTLLDELEGSEANDRAVGWSALLHGDEDSELWLEWAERDVVGHAQFAQRVRTHLEEHSVSEITVHSWSGGRARIRLRAVDVPGCGVQGYLIRPRARSEPASLVDRPASASEIELDGASVENEFFRLTAEDDGTFTLVDRRTGRVFSGLNRFVDCGDRGDEYNFCPPENDRCIDSPAEPPTVTAGDTGIRGQYLELRLQYQVPAGLTEDRQTRRDETVPLAIVTRAWLQSGVPRVDFETHVENAAEDHRLRVRFPTVIVSDHTLTENAFDLVARGFEQPTKTDDWVEQPEPTQPQQTFILIEDDDGGVLLANRGLPEVEAVRDEEDDEITFALTLLRCVGWLSRTDFPCRRGPAGPHLETPEAQMQGQWTFRYAFVPYTDRWAAINQAHSFNAPPVAAVAPAARGGALDLRGSLLEVAPDGFLITTVKPAEDGRGLVVRGFNATAAQLDVTLRFGWPVSEAYRVNLLEHEDERLAVTDGAVHVRAGPKEIVSVKLLQLD